MKKGLLILVTGIMLFTGLKAQEGHPMYNAYLFDNFYALHPSMAGIADCAKIRFNYRDQWAKLENSPVLYSLSAEGRIARNAGIGVLIYSDKNGNTSQNNIQLTYNYMIDMADHRDKFKVLALALSYQASLFSVDVDQIKKDNPGSGNDPVLSNSAGKINHNVGLSVSFVNEDFFASVSANNLVPISKSKNYDESQSELNVVATVGNSFKLGDSGKLYIEPSVSVIYHTQKPYQFVDLNTKLYYNDRSRDLKMWVGVSGRLVNDEEIQARTISPILGGKYQKYSFGYSYDIDMDSNVSSGLGATHQISLGIDLFCDAKRRYCNCSYN